MGHPNTKKHKANHCGYNNKPSLREVGSLMGLYAAISDAATELTVLVATPGEGKPRLGTPMLKPGTQLSLF